MATKKQTNYLSNIPDYLRNMDKLPKNKRDALISGSPTYPDQTGEDNRKQNLVPMPNQHGPDTFTFTVALPRKHEHKSRIELIPKALTEYAQAVKNQVTFKILRDETTFYDDVKTFFSRKDPFESEDGVLVWWD